MKNQEISTLIGQKRAYNSSSFLLYFSKNEKRIPKKAINIAILASKKNFKTAVLRNKVKRRVRNAINTIKKPSINNFNLIFSLKKGFEKVVFKDLVEEIKQSLVKNAII